MHAFIAGGIAVAAIVLRAGATLSPLLLPSSTDPAHGLTVPLVATRGVAWAIFN